MKILMASTPATGHINPMLAIGHVLMDAGHELTFLTGSWARERIEAAGAKFRALPPAADLDLRDLHAAVPELAGIPPGLDWMRVALEHVFIDRVTPQLEGLQETLREFPADVIVGDDMIFGVVPMLLGPRAARPPVVLCGTSFLHWCRKDGAPHFLGLPPATMPAEREKYAAITEEYDRVVNQPAARRLNQALADLGLGPLLLTLFDSVVALADAYLQLTVPGFEFPGDIPPWVHFVGTPPIISRQAPLPPWEDDLDGSRKVVLVTQGTVANHDFGLLVAPTLAALANERDVLVVATTGGRPVDAIPGPIPANARVASFLPFEWLLPQVDVLVTNGGYGSVNQAMSLGIPLVTAGLTEDKADVNVRVGWSGVGIDLATNEPTPASLREAIRTVLDTPRYRARAASIAAEFRRIDTRAEILRIVEQVVTEADDDAEQYDVADRRAARANSRADRFIQPAIPSP
jgi:MGT family glycosyltransferase